MKKNKLIVSGSKGFIGSNLLSILADEKYSVFTIDQLDGIDLSRKEDLKGIQGFDVFIHLANLSYVPESFNNPESFYRTNYLTTLNALELCRENNARLVFLSSYIYGTPEYLPVNEGHALKPFNPYAQSKYICEILCDGYLRDFGVKTTILRPFNVYGNGQKGKLLIPEIFDQLINGCRIIKLRDSSPRRDYINVIDVVKAIKLCIDNNDKHGTYNICSGKSYSVKEVTEIINSNLIRPVDFVFGKTDRINEVNETVGSYKKFQHDFNWSPSISFEKGIKDIINNYIL